MTTFPLKWLPAHRNNSTLSIVSLLILVIRQYS